MKGLVGQYNVNLVSYNHAHANKWFFYHDQKYVIEGMF
jgi:hypothetical protein